MTDSDGRLGEIKDLSLGRLRREHLYVEDCWYSCPKAPEGCCDDAQGDECNCGADEHNALLDGLIGLVAEAVDLLEHIPFGTYGSWARDGNTAAANKMDEFDERRNDVVRRLRNPSLFGRTGD